MIQFNKLLQLMFLNLKIVLTFAKLGQVEIESFGCISHKLLYLYCIVLHCLVVFGSGTAESPISHLVRTAATATAAAACVQQILNHVIG